MGVLATGTAFAGGPLVEEPPGTPYVPRELSPQERYDREQEQRQRSREEWRQSPERAEMERERDRQDRAFNERLDRYNREIDRAERDRIDRELQGGGVTLCYPGRITTLCIR